MNRLQIAELNRRIRLCSFINHQTDMLEDAFKKAVSEEREACAKIADRHAGPDAYNIALEIRDRSEAKDG